MAKPRLSVRVAKSSLAFGESLRFEVDVTNVGTGPLDVVAERMSAAKDGSAGLHVFLGQQPHEAGGGYYRFVVPKLKRVRAGSKTTLPISVGLPLREGIMDNGDYAWREIPLQGRVEVTVFMGFFDKPPTFATDDPWGEFVAQQKIAKARPVRIDIA